MLFASYSIKRRTINVRKALLVFVEFELERMCDLCGKNQNATKNRRKKGKIKVTYMEWLRIFCNCVKRIKPSYFIYFRWNHTCFIGA